MVIHSTRFQIEVLALQALLYDSRGEGSAALKRLAKALGLAEPGGFIRLFIDLGPQMADLLKRLIKQNVAVSYGGKILAAFREDQLMKVSNEADHPIASPHLSLPISPSPSLSTAQLILYYFQLLKLVRSCAPLCEVRILSIFHA